MADDMCCAASGTRSAYDDSAQAFFDVSYVLKNSAAAACGECCIY
jgi:hypothetical protein